ncbi:sugar ABC transporter ATP-binding protein [Martelella mediterranea]|uniref:sugar ABC transporter ATP-binding protein n=1 Tax=Martelella mediterranea TaxID=293089 RepID=UPI001E4B0807|nr:sugar ABC transporter ATP-binding protein [Martelella mediterranea]MCD1634802.1 sugar ABC transporter ATP-binding protein [Martelella mediterranea]
MNTTAREPLLEFKGLGKSFFGVQVVKGVDLALGRGEILCLVGENGAGKSTMMNMLGGVHIPDEGIMLLAGEPYAPEKPADASAAGIAFIHQELNLFGNLSIAENILLNRLPHIGRLPIVNRRRMRREAEEAMRQVGLDLSPDTKVDTLAPGEKQLVEIAKALALDARIIILDEPTTSLTTRETEVLFALLKRLRAEGRSMIYISHVLADVMALADQILVLRDGSRVDGGPTGEFDIDRMILSMVGRSLEQLFPERHAAIGAPVLEVENLSQPGVIRDISFSLKRGEVLGFFGLMGAGRSEMARVLFGLDPHSSGRIALNGEALPDDGARDRVARGMAFVTEDRRHEGLLMDSSIRDNMALVSLGRFAGAGGMVKADALSEEIGDMSSRLRLRTGDPTLSIPVHSLSGGNQQKVVIGKWVMNRPEVLIMDEPTRGIDVGAKYEVFTIMNQLAEEGVGILYISSELDELIGVADRILVMHQGMLSASFERGQFDRQAILSAAFGGRKAA